ncbi:hypothetical protein Csp2054_11205 [Curtobacterium sp. 'Ferrero']|uniref:glycoside hydrolase family 16 protein n=1 Tax=Curtobacterium sp. 'Ferrero' TaxID=2033654 RepID=UPI000BC7FBB9|nr:glycoside hydrolase family 16 protein [Curtobacterium sp. 'Ferrero']PCN47669.1 hypothetical protein Csp2054_11205 [Curtobacterium sp. 'Ferrero']
MPQHRSVRAALTALVLVAGLSVVPFGTTTPALADTSAPRGNIGAFKQDFVQDFRTNATAGGQFAKTYANSWQPYPDGMSGMYYSGRQISAHAGFMDVVLDGKHGAAGTFGTPTGAWDRRGGKFSIRARALGGDGNGAAFMLWPTSNVWTEGEIDYPEANFEDAPMSHQHSMKKGKEVTATSASTNGSWRSWHVYSIEWIPGKYVRYLFDNRVISTVRWDVPKTSHRYMFQVGNWGKAGHLEIDWVTTYRYTG